MVCRLTHGKKPDQQVIQPIQALQGSYALSGKAALLRRAWRMVIPDKIPYSYTGIAATLGPPQAPSVWNVGNFSVITAQSGNPTGRFNVAATGPSGYTAGGTYDALSGTDLPAGMTLSAAGMIDVGTATATQSASGVVFGYTEPGAIPAITIYSGAVAGVLPYMGAVYPCEGAVPAGCKLRSPEDTTMRSVVTSTWPDGSAQVVVFHSHINLSANSQTTISLLPTTAADSSPLTAAYIDGLLTSIDFASFGSASASTITSFATPEWIWWASSQAICARYRHPIGLGVMEAIIDIHAFANGRVFVEVVIENCKTTFTTYPTPIPAIADQTYTNATVTLNGTQIGICSTANMQTFLVHQKTRAWYCSGWIGGNPLTSITHDSDAMQKHPMFWKKATPITSNFSATQLTGLAQWGGATLVYQPYTSDTYTPWATGRYSRRGQEGQGETSRGFVGLLNGWEIDYLMTGDKRPASSIVQGSYTLLTRHLNWRDEATGSCLITSAQLQGRQQLTGVSTPAAGTASFFPSVYHYPYGGDNGFANYECSHQPASPIMAFMLRPSPVYIEICQKTAVFNHTLGTTTGIQNQSSAAWRGRGWAMRNTGLACFITPDSQTGAAAWKTSMRGVMAGTADLATAYDSVSWNTLDTLYDYTTTNFSGVETALSIGRDGIDSDKAYRARYQINAWFHYFALQGWKMISEAKVMRTSTEISRWETAVSYMCKMPIRMINESAATGEWRFQPYTLTIGDYFDDTPGPRRIVMASNWKDCINSDLTGTIADAPANVWLYADAYHAPDEGGVVGWSEMSAQMTHAVTYAERFWSALVVCVERDEPGAAAAWATVNAAINIPSWLSTAGDAPIYNRLPRNV